MLVHDFAYAETAFDGYVPPSILEAEGAKECAVELYSITKRFSMAGWRLGFLVGNPEIVAALAKLKSYLDYGTFQPIQIAATVTLNEAQDYPKLVNDIYQSRRDALCDGLERIGWHFPRPKGTMFAWAPIPEPYRADGVARVRQAHRDRLRRGRVARRGVRPWRRRFRAVRAHRERAAHRPGHTEPAPRPPEAGLMPPTIEEILAADHEWYHSITLADGVATPGRVDLRPYLDLAAIPDDLTGKRALDVGSFDGFWAFEFERRGAAVVAIDTDRSPWPDVARIHWSKIPVKETLGTGFRLLREYFGSSVDRRTLDIDDLTVDAIGGPVDVAFVGALLLHLRDPCGALERVRDVLVPGGQLILVEPVDGPLSEGDLADEPVARCRLGDTTITWWYPSTTCLSTWITGAGFVGGHEVGRQWFVDTLGGRQLTVAVHATNPG